MQCITTAILNQATFIEIPATWFLLPGMWKVQKRRPPLNWQKITKQPNGSTAFYSSCRKDWPRQLGHSHHRLHRAAQQHSQLRSSSRAVPVPSRTASSYWKTLMSCGINYSNSHRSICSACHAAAAVVYACFDDMGWTDWTNSFP